MAELGAVAAGGAAGSACRYLVSGLAARWLGGTFPVGTLVVNLGGSFLIGVLFVVLVERTAVAPLWHLLLIAGLLGGFTTFSAFSLETLVLLQQGRPAEAVANVLLNVGLCLAAVWAGYALAARWPAA